MTNFVSRRKKEQQPPLGFAAGKNMVLSNFDFMVLLHEASDSVQSGISGTLKSGLKSDFH